MKRIILVSAIALLAACGSNKGDVSGASGGQTSTTTANTSVSDGTVTSIKGSDDTITIDNFGDMPKKCIDLLSAFLKKIEPTVSAINWDTTTYGDFQTFGKTFQADSDPFDAETEAAGCNKYNLSGSDDKQFAQMSELAAADAPGTLAFLKFLNTLSVSAKATSGSIPTDCPGTIAAIEPFLAKGGTLKDLTMLDFTQLGQLLSAVSSNCTSDESTAFFARADVTAFIKP